MRTFIILWLGQMVSSIGSSMTFFVVTLWVWQQTESVTAIALITLFFQLPQIGISLFSGILVDRIPRKHLLILSDLVAAGCTLSIGVLYASHHLQLWHLYLIAAILGCSENVQSLTYSTTVSLVVPKQHYTRASSMGAMVGYGSWILAPAFAGVLYPVIGLLGITVVDLSTFAIAIVTMLVVKIPKTRIPKTHIDPEKMSQDPGVESLWQKMTFGFRYLNAQPSLWTVVIAMSSFAFLNQVGETLYQPMILAQTEGNAQILGTVVAASGIGGVTGALVLSFWGGFRRRVSGMLIGFIGTGLSKLILGIGQLPAIWITAQFWASLHSPLISSSYTAMWYVKVAPERQGRVFAVDYLIGLVIEASASLIAGFLADRVFEPAMQPGGQWVPLFSSLFGSGKGTGIAFLYALTAIGIVTIGLAGYRVKSLNSMEDIVPDHSDG